MKTTKINLRIKTLSVFLLICLFTLFFSCDVLEPDADVLEPEVTLKEDQIYVLSNGLAFIDLNTKVMTNAPVRLSITSSTQHGELSDLGKGLFQYLPTAANKKAHDAFEFTVFSENNQILKKDTIIIIIENDSTHLPCGIFPTNDYVYNVKKNKPVTVDVLANDNICGYDSSGLVVSVYRPDSTFSPKHGSAVVSGHRIIYTADNSFEGTDKLIYKVSPRGNPEVAAFGVVYFTGEQSCSIALTNDSFTFLMDSVQRVYVLPALGNDSLCNASGNQQIDIAQAPQHGTAQIIGNAIRYEVDSTVIIPPSASFTDFFYYEVCADAICKTARVDITIIRILTDTCVFKAVMDTIHLSDTVSQVVQLDVLQNDSLCGDSISTFAITQAPNHGVAYPAGIGNNRMMMYQPDSTFFGNDSLEYEICNPVKCSRAKVLIRLEL